MTNRKPMNVALDLQSRLFKGQLHKPKETEVFFNTCFDKGQLKKVIAWFLDQYGEKKTVDLVETLKQVGFHQATRAGVSLGIDDLQIPPQKSLLISQASHTMETVRTSKYTGKLTMVEKSQQLIDTWNETSEAIRHAAVQNFRATNPVNPVYMMAFSGARGNISQVRQLVGMRGLMADPQGTIVEFPIQSNFREGLTVTEYLISCYGARKGLVDTALRTATSGYLTRRLVEAVQHVVVHVQDCGTPYGIRIRDKNIEQRLIGRVLLRDIQLNSTHRVAKNTLVSSRLAKLIAATHKEILVRSPLTCQTEKSVCQLCYGLDLGQGKLVHIGEAVGIIAAQSIGEPGTQLTMRTFHTGGVGVFSEQSLQSLTAPFAGKIEFPEAVSGLFVRTPHGDLAYLLKHKPSNQNKPLLRLQSFFHQESYHEISYNDVPAGSLLWVKQGEKVKAGQLLIQVSRLETKKQDLPETSHPVVSPISGEAYFEFMQIQEIRKRKGSLKNLKDSLKQETDRVPVIPELSNLGSFWILSSSLTKHPKVVSAFFKKGDLLSRDTLLYYYNISVPFKGQIKEVNTSHVLGALGITISLSKIKYSGGSYFSCVKPHSFHRNIVVFTPFSTQTLLTWYPTFQNISGYYSALMNSTSLFSKGDERFKPETQLTGYCWSPHPVVELITPKKSFSKGACVLFTKKYFFWAVDDFFSKPGFFQLENFGNGFQKTYKQTKDYLLINPLNRNSLSSQKLHFWDNNRKNKEKIRRQGLRKSTLFITRGLKTAGQKVSVSNHTKVIEKQMVWFCLSDMLSPEIKQTHLTGILVEPGKRFESLCFHNSYIFPNIIQCKNLTLVKRKYHSQLFEKFYEVPDFLNKNPMPFNQQKSHVTKFWNRHSGNTFSFYKKDQLLSSMKREPSAFKFSLQRKRKSAQLLAFQKTNYCLPPETKILKQKWLETTKQNCPFSLQSPLFTKQYKTSRHSFSNVPKLNCSFHLKQASISGWCFPSQIIKIEFPVQASQALKKIDTIQQKIITNRFTKTSISGQRKPGSEIFIPQWSLFFYTELMLENSTKFRFDTFESGWVLPEYPVTRVVFKTPQSGEFQGIQQKEKQPFKTLNIVRNADRLTFQIHPNFKGEKEKTLGLFVRWGHELGSGWALPASGQIVKVTQNTVTLRKGIPLLASARGLIHVSLDDFIEKHQLLVTLKSTRLETEDIVQGIPKIEQLFEARETKGGEIIKNNMHLLLERFYRRASRVRSNREAVRISLNYIQNFLVENIVQAYSNQGVDISEKHVEIVVRQMTARVRIINGGDTGLLPGELIQLRVLEKMNRRLKKIRRRPSSYAPVILGITKSVLESESFLLATSFQQVSKVLVKSALSKKTDFLRGLNENLVFGEIIPAGTGILTVSREKSEKTKQFPGSESSESLQFETKQTSADRKPNQ